MKIFSVIFAALLSLLISFPAHAAGASVRQSPRTIKHEALKRRWREVQQSNYSQISALSQLFHSETYGLSIYFPKDWHGEEVLQTSGGVTTIALFLSPLQEGDTEQENMNLLVEDIRDTGLTLDDYTRRAVQQEQNIFSDYTLFSSVPLQITGFPAHSIRYSAVFHGRTLFFEQVWVLREGKVYVLTFAAPEETFQQYTMTFRQMVGTFSFEP
ncbi:MAG: hypothetical protein WCS85_00325 [Candidatus Peribacteraceae bacterium]|jgi:hypothetical protein